MPPKISYIILFYNQEALAEEAINSALAQEGPPIEVVISDDASVDQTFAVAQKCAAAYHGPHKVVLNKNTKNLGVTGNFQKAFTLCSGQWIVAAGGDDLSQKTRVQRIVDTIKTNPGVMAISSHYSMVTAAGDPLPVSDEWFSAMVLMQEWPLEKVLTRACWGRPMLSLLGAATAWHRDLFEKFPSLSEAPRYVSEDSVLRWRALLLGYVRLIPDKLVVYRRLAGSLTHFDQGAGLLGREEYKMKMLGRALDGYVYSRSDFLWANKKGFISSERLANCLSKLDYLISYQKAQLEFPKASVSRKIGLLLMYFRAGLWRRLLGKS